MLSKVARGLLDFRHQPSAGGTSEENGRNAVAMCGKHSEVLGLMEHAARHWRRMFVLGLTAVSVIWATPAGAAETVNAYSIWPENWARPMLQEFETATGIKVNFLRFSSGEALARVLAEKNNPKVDVLFGGPVETFAAGIKEGVFEPYKPPAATVLPSRFKEADGYWTAIADDPLVFMTNQKFLAENKLSPPASWDDLLNPAFKNMLQMADARTSGTAVTRIFSVLEVNGRDEEKAFAYLKKLRANVQLYTKSGGGGTLPVGLGQAGGGIFWLFAISCG
jgi:iron(III) transport system substrate-binding protein